MNQPHGGELINRLVKKSELDLDNIDLEYSLDNNQISEVLNITTGVYSPLKGFMSEEDMTSVMNEMKMADGTVWSIPIFLPVNKSEFAKVKAGSQVLMKDLTGKEIGLLLVSSKYKIPKQELAKKVW